MSSTLKISWIFSPSVVVIFESEARSDKVNDLVNLLENNFRPSAIRIRQNALSSSTVPKEFFVYNRISSPISRQVFSGTNVIALEKTPLASGPFSS